MRQSREECWGRQQELAAVREKLSNLKTTLEDRRKDIVSYTVTPCGSKSLPPPSLPQHEISVDLKPCQRKLQHDDLKPQFLHLSSVMMLMFK